MMRFRRLIHLVGFSLIFVATGASAQVRELGIFGLWGAFSDGARCYAIARPAESTHRSEDAAVSVGYWPTMGALGQIYLRLGAEKRAESAVLLRIDGRSFQLTGRGRDAWTPDARADAEIVTAMRGGLVMTVETRSVRGALVRERYRLQGAPSAVDAAALACARR